MTSSLQTRLGRLEAATGGGGGGWDGPPCEECGWRGPDDDSEPERHTLTFYGDKDFEHVPLDESGEVLEFCSTCGRKLVWFVSFADLYTLYYLKVPKS